MEVLNDNNRITLWKAADEPIDSSYGKLSYEEWCQLELARIARSGENLRIMRRDDGTIALYRVTTPPADSGAGTSESSIADGGSGKKD